MQPLPVVPGIDAGENLQPGSFLDTEDTATN
jgi:hypothetical protein